MAACTNCGREQAPHGLDYGRAADDARCWAESSHLDRDRLDCERVARAAAEARADALAGALQEATGYEGVPQHALARWALLLEAHGKKAMGA